MRALIVGVVVAGCWSSPPPAPPKPQPHPATPSFVADTNEAVVTGRVLVNGAPVTEFALQHATSWTSSSLHPTFTIVSQRTGRFEVRLPPGTWDLIIAGRGFARTLFLRTKLTNGQVTNLGDITPRPGFTITGRVLDSQAQPIAGAEVTIRGSFTREPITDSLESLARGDYFALTDAGGNYRLDGVTQLSLQGASLNLSASRPGIGAALPVRIPAGDLRKDIVLEPAGSIDGLAPGGNGYVIVQPVSRRTFVFGSMTNGSFAIKDLPAGNYQVSPAGFAGKLVTVVANQTTSVTFP